MKYMLQVLATVLPFALLFSACGADPSNDAKAIEGNWKLVAAEVAGQPMAESVMKTISLKMDNGKYEVFVGSVPDRGTYSLDPGSTPKAITVVGTEGPNQGRTFPAIYELAGDSLRICYDLSGAKRPAGFKTLAGTKLYLATYKRQ